MAAPTSPRLREANGASVLDVSAASGNASVTTTTGSLDVTTMTATGGTATLSANAGSITDANAGANNVTATSLVASASTGIDLDTTVTNLTATDRNSGEKGLREADGANVLNVSAAHGSANVTTASRSQWGECPGCECSQRQRQCHHDHRQSRCHDHDGNRRHRHALSQCRFDYRRQRRCEQRHCHEPGRFCFDRY